jgi:V8-like Glu-specific endopeptidase
VYNWLIYEEYFVRTTLSKHYFQLFILLLASINSYAMSTEHSLQSVYESDNRVDVYSAPSSIQDLGRSIPAQFNKETFVNKGGSYLLQSVSLARRHRSNCPDVKFSEQIIGPKCTGFLVAPNVVMTAGHCMRTPEDCTNFLWAFDFKLKAAKDSSYTSIPASSVYSCKKVLAQKYEYFEGQDYALIQLDRNVEGRSPLAIDFDSDYAVGSAHFVLGYPSGLPLKYADSGILSKELEKVYYTTLDTFHGNSGSPTFDTTTNKVTGIVSMGNGDYVWNSSGTCKEVKVTRADDNYSSSTSFKIKLMKEVFDQAIQSSH